MTTQLPEGYQSFVEGDGFAIIEMDVLRLSGQDRITVLNNLCTANVKELESGQGLESFITDVRGKCVGHVFVFQWETHSLIIGQSGQSQRLADHIDRYVIREDVEISDISQRSVAAIYCGREQACRHLTGNKLASPLLRSSSVQIGDQLAACLEMPLTSNRDCVLVFEDLPQSAVAELLDPKKQVSLETFQSARIENGWPLHGIDFGDTNLPQEVSRDGLAICFTKGCYLGQETVARLDALGQVQRKLLSMKVAGEHTPTLPVKLTLDDKEMGEISSMTWSPTQECLIAIGMVRRKCFEAGSTMNVAGTELTATVL